MELISKLMNIIAIPHKSVTFATQICSFQNPITPPMSGLPILKEELALCVLKLMK
jgi:hypothetical protein